MRKLLLIRHAKSSWKFPELDDHDRPLNKRGRRDVLRMAKHIAEKESRLDIVFSSTAIRAVALAETICEYINAPLIPRSNFYTFSSRELLKALSCLPDENHQIAVVAHNPAITEVVNYLVKGKLANIPTSGVAAVLPSVQKWSGLLEKRASCELSYFDFPKMLAD
ncbi:MAG: histidine phosphatase family protein [Acidiferrobacterales bacterium]|nr:histidine phosphatase family protein [Acidiferrobacterales bacterium]